MSETIEIPTRLPTIVIAGHNHFDPTWRRCFERPAAMSNAYNNN